MAVATTKDEGNTARSGSERRADSDSPSRPRKALTIGAVAKILSQEFDDISISKIRYLEDQKLVTPRRTQGGYRLYSQTDVERLRAILRMQRDEFLPLRVIRQELATGDFTGSRPGSEAAATRRAASVEAPVSMLAPEELLDQAGVSEGLLRELQEYGIVQPDRRDGRSFNV
jgi:DNA-binding transcriptional MerR regulator